MKKQWAIEKSYFAATQNTLLISEYQDFISTLKQNGYKIVPVKKTIRKSRKGK
jgi:hypothetical protein